MKNRNVYLRPVTEVFDMLSHYLCIEMDPNVSTGEQLGKSHDIIDGWDTDDNGNPWDSTLWDDEASEE